MCAFCVVVWCLYPERCWFITFLVCDRMFCVHDIVLACLHAYYFSKSRFPYCGDTYSSGSVKGYVRYAYRLKSRRFPIHSKDARFFNKDVRDWGDYILSSRKNQPLYTPVKLSRGGPSHPFHATTCTYLVQQYLHFPSVNTGVMRITCTALCTHSLHTLSPGTSQQNRITIRSAFRSSWGRVVGRRLHIRTVHLACAIR